MKVAEKKIPWSTIKGMEDERGKEEKAMIVKITEINGLGDEGSNMDIAQNC